MEYQDGSLRRGCHGHDLAEVPGGRGSGGSGRWQRPWNLPVGLLRGFHAGGCHSQVARKYGGSLLLDQVFVHDIPSVGPGNRAYSATRRSSRALSAGCHTLCGVAAQAWRVGPRDRP